MDRYDDATAYLERALIHAERADALAESSWVVGLLGLITVYGPLPVDAGIARCRELRDQVAGLRGQAAELRRMEAVLLAMRGNFDEARALHDEGDRLLAELGNRVFLAAEAFTRTPLELLAGNPSGAQRAAFTSLQAYEAMDNRSQGSTAAALLALALVEQGRDDEALTHADQAASWAAHDDRISQVLQLGVRARVLARRGALDAAEAAARDAVTRSSASDDPWMRGEALVALALVLERAGRAEQSAAALGDALVLYERKGNVASAGRVGALMSGHTRSTRQGA
jgi:tetratricopeptide (TPR) repeat protein